MVTQSRQSCSMNPFRSLTLSLPKFLMEFCKVTLTFELADEIVWCDHSNESSLPVLSYSAICFSKFYKLKFANFGRNLPLATFGSERVKGFLWRAYKRRGFYRKGFITGYSKLCWLQMGRGNEWGSFSAVVGQSENHAS